MIRQNFDLHIHSNYSDGIHSISEIIGMAKEYDIKTIAITDHDDIKSINDLNDMSLDSICYIPGIEISTYFLYEGKKYDLHILGYGYDFNNEDLINLTKDIKNKRVDRFVKIAKYLEDNFNIYLPKDEVLSVALKENAPGRPHMGKLLVKYNYASSVADAFSKYLEDVDVDIEYRGEMKKVIQILKNANAKVIWAHPRKAEKKYNIDINYLLDPLIDLGLDGIEVYNSIHTYEDTIRLKKIADAKNILISGGSDFHGKLVKPNVDLGVIYGSGEDILINNSDISILKLKNK